MLVLARKERETVRIYANGGEFLLTRHADAPDTGSVVLMLSGPNLRLRFVGRHGDVVGFNIGRVNIGVNISRRGGAVALGFDAPKSVVFKRDELVTPAA